MENKQYDSQNNYLQKDKLPLTLKVAIPLVAAGIGFLAGNIIGVERGYNFGYEQGYEWGKFEGREKVYDEGIKGLKTKINDTKKELEKTREEIEQELKRQKDEKRRIS
jgi:hypothetical protein